MLYRAFKVIVGLALLYIVVKAVQVADTQRPVEFTGESKANLEKRIRDEGYVCPGIKEAWDNGVRPLGQTVTVHCSPTIIFKVIMRPNGDVSITPAS